MGETVLALVTIVAFIFVFNALLSASKRPLRQPAQKDDWPPPRAPDQRDARDSPRLAFQFTVGTETTTYDSDAYRFGGSAYPEYRITYADSDGVVTEREIFVDNWYSRDGVHHLKCWCFLRDEKRQFRSDRILSSVNLSTNRKIKDIVAHKQRW